MSKQKGKGIATNAAQVDGLQHHGYEDVEGLTVSLGVIFALLLPAAMSLQNQSFDDGVQSKNFMLLLCTEPSFRSYVVETLTDPDHGDIGQYGPELFNWQITLGRGRVLDTKTILQSGSNVWKWDGGSPESIYSCGENAELATTIQAIHEVFPAWRMDMWALMNPEAILWSDHLSAMSSFGMCILIAGLGGSLVTYVSLALSAGREDESGTSLKAWLKIGWPLLASLAFVLIGGVVVLLFANDAYTESQDPFFLRSSRFGGYSKLALLCVFAPITLGFIVASTVGLVKSCRNAGKGQQADGDGDGAPETRRWNV